MNYSKIYDDIIKRGKIRQIENPITEYVEKHHIIPKCMGGDNSSENIVILTPEEHYLCHQILIKIYPKNRKLLHAAFMMCMHSPNRNCRSNNKLYGWLKRHIYSKDLYYRTMVDLTCDVCHKQFQRQPANYKITLKCNNGCYCSQSCSNKGRKIKSKKVGCHCEECKSIFYKTPYFIKNGLARFCSRKCSNKFNSKINRSV